MIFKRTKVTFDGGPLDGQKWGIRGEADTPDEIVADGFEYEREGLDTEAYGFATYTTYVAYSGKLGDAA